jgi:hypothetical protein
MGWRIAAELGGDINRYSQLHASFHDALCLDVLVAGIFRVRIEMIVIDGELTAEVIHDVWGSRPA